MSDTKSNKSDYNFSTRLRELMDIWGYETLAQLATDIGHARSETLSRIARDPKAKPSVDVVAALSNKFDDLNIHWFLTGQGSPRIEGRRIPRGRVSPEGIPKGIPNATVDPAVRYMTPPVVTIAPDGEPNIVVLDAQAAAGMPMHLHEPEFFESKPAFRLPGERYRHGTFIALQVSGDSMEPTVGHHDWLVARYEVDPLVTLREGYLYVLVAKDGVVAKRLFRAPGGRAFICRSDNELYPPYELPLEEALQVYRVQAVLSEDVSNKGADIRERISRLERDVMALQHPTKRR